VAKPTTFLPPTILILFSFWFSQAFAQDTLVNQEGKLLGEYLHSRIMQDLRNSKANTQVNVRGVVLVHFKLNGAGDVTELDFIEASNNCEPTPALIIENVKTGLLNDTIRWRSTAASFDPEAESYYLLPIMYSLGSSLLMCKTDEGWTNIYSWAGIEYKFIKEISIELN
jgi:hypothetical protein